MPRLPPQTAYGLSPRRKMLCTSVMDGHKDTTDVVSPVGLSVIIDLIWENLQPMCISPWSNPRPHRISIYCLAAVYLFTR